MPFFKDHYLTLGVARNASPEQIRQAYRALARQYHPDLNKSPLAESRFKSVGEAYETLRDPERRAEYDDLLYHHRTAAHQQGDIPRRGRPPVKGEGRWNGFPGTGTNGSHGPNPWQEPASGGRKGGNGGKAGGFGSDGFRQQTEWRQKANKGEEPSPTSLRQRERPFRFGAEAAAVPLDVTVRLPLHLEDAYHGGMQEVVVEMAELGGQRIFHVRIPAGILPGKKIRLKGQGLSSGDGEGAGDLFLLVEIVPHYRYRLEGKDLHASLPITPWEAALGGSVEVATLAGRVAAKVPAGSSSGRKIRLRGRGFPAAGEEPGDLILILQVAIPQELNDQERELFTQLAQISRFNPRE